MNADGWIWLGVMVFVVGAYIIGTIVEQRAKDAVRRMDREDNAEARYAEMIRRMRR